jgi:MFS family permease
MLRSTAASDRPDEVRPPALSALPAGLLSADAAVDSAGEMDARSLRRGLLSLSAVVGAYAFVQNMVAPCLPAIAEHFDVGVSSSGLVFSVFFLAASLSIPLATKLAQAWGTRRVFRLMLAVVCVGGVLTAAAPTFPLLLVGRAAQGLIGAALPLAVSAIRYRWPVAQIPAAVGVLSGSGGLGGCLGVAVGGPLADAAGFRSVLAVAAGVTLLAFALLRWAPSAPSFTDTPTSWQSVGLVCSAVVGVSLGLDLVPRLGLGVLWWFVAALLAVPALWRLLRRALASAEPRTFRVSVTALIVSGVAGFITFIQFTLVPYAVDTHEQAAARVLGGSATAAAVCLLLLNIGIYVGGVSLGWLWGRAPAAHTLTLWAMVTVVGIGVAVVGLHWLVALLIGQALAGLGVGALLAGGQTLLTDVLPASRIGSASGDLIIAKNIGSVLGGQVFASSLALAGRSVSLPGGALVETLVVGALAAVVLMAVLSLTLPHPEVLRG